MGVVKTPTYTLNTDIIFNGIESIKVTDNIKDTSDSVEITCKSCTADIEKESKIEVFLGYKESGLYKVGDYVLNAIERESDRTIVHFSSVDFKDSLKEKRNTSYQKTYIDKIVAKIAKRNKLQYKCDFNNYIEHLDQKNLSDVEMLNRLADSYNAIFNVI